MELRRYIEIFRQRWWLVASATLITTLLTAFIVVVQPPVYESSGTFVVRPRSIESDEIVRAFDTLNRGIEINTTYARIAESDLIKNRAKGQLGGDLSSRVAIDADVVVGTNILEIAASGEDPTTVYELAKAVGSATVAYIAELDDVFGLVPLDAPEQPSEPTGPNRPLTMALGVVVGLFLGLGLAVLGEYVGSPVKVRRQFDIIDPTTGSHTEEFFKLRFRQELSRTKQGSQMFSLGVLKVTDSWEKGSDGQVPAEDLLWKVAREIEQDLREEDILAYLAKGTYSVLLPDLPVEDAERLVMTWQQLVPSLGERRPEDGQNALKVSVGVCEYGGEGANGVWDEDELANLL